MKKEILIMLAVVFLATVSCTAIRQPGGQTDGGMQAAIEQAVAERHFKIDVERAYPMSGRVIYLTSPYSLTVRGDSVYSYLPYFGVAYTAPVFGSSIGLNFNGVLTDYSSGQGRRGETTARFHLASKEDSFEYRVEIDMNGFTTLYVTPQNRQVISFEGQFDND